MRPHPAAALFPLVPDAELRELVEDIRAHGVRQPVVTYRGELLDGRNRIRACDLIGFDPPSVEYEGSDPVGFVISANLRRRHMDDGQRAMVAARLANLKSGQRADQAAQICAGVDSGSEALPPVVTQTQAADLLGVSRRSVQHARVVIEHGAPELVAAVEQGEASVSAAATVASLPAAEQVAAVAVGEVAAVAQRARKPAPGTGKPPPPQPEVDCAMAPPSAKSGDGLSIRSSRTARQPEPEDANYSEREAEVDDLREAVGALTEINSELATENALLREAVAIGRLPAGDRFEVERILAEMREEVAGLRVEHATMAAALRAVEATRDKLMDENAQLKRQCATRRREIVKLREEAHGTA